MESIYNKKFIHTHDILSNKTENIINDNNKSRCSTGAYSKLNSNTISNSSRLKNRSPSAEKKESNYLLNKKPNGRSNSIENKGNKIKILFYLLI